MGKDAVASWRERRLRRAALYKLGLKTYEEYLQTLHWQGFRTRVLDQQAEKNEYNFCERCGERTEKVTRMTALHVHHRTYERLGEERIEDVEIVCRKCHEKEHGHDAASRVRHFAPGYR